MKIRVVIEPGDEGGYTIHVPSLPGCISEGDSLQEALANIQEAIGLYPEPVDERPDGIVNSNFLLRA